MNLSSVTLKISNSVNTVFYSSIVKDMKGTVKLGISNISNTVED